MAKAFEAGYRHIDTAQMYGNEQGVGDAIAASGIARDELYVTTKLNNGFHRPDDARRELAASLERLQLDHVDLVLIHWPLPTRYDGDYVSTWRALVDFQKSGGATSIGVSNFQPDHLDRIIEETGVVPVVNQIEVHPFFSNQAARAASAGHDIAVEAWSPIAQGAANDDSAIKGIAAKVERTPAQVALRWHLRRGDIGFPKSMRPERMAENFALFDFELSAGRAVWSPTATSRPENLRLGTKPRAPSHASRARPQASRRWASRARSISLRDETSRCSLAMCASKARSIRSRPVSVSATTRLRASPSPTRRLTRPRSTQRSTRLVTAPEDTMVESASSLGVSSYGAPARRSVARTSNSPSPRPNSA
ncbi:MAG: aldo/keto reductase [Nocardioides sp.]|nr:aldo/keto reductase [Nocardioides sp.]